MLEDRPTGAVLVYGAGIAGVQASLDLADSGFKVYLVDRSPAIGGRMSALDKTFPTGDCAMCILSPKLVECGRNKNVEIVTLSEIESVSGEPGRFEVQIKRNPRYVDMKKCNACGDCAMICPVSLPSEFDAKLGTRKAIYRQYPQAIPNVYGISKAEGAAPCKAACPAGVNAQGYVALIAAGKFAEAYGVIRERCPLPSVCGRICQHPCETACNRQEIDEPVAIRDLKRFAAEWVYDHKDKLPEAKPPAELREERVAVIGGGPGGLTAAYDLSHMGYRVTIFEAADALGGMLRHGVPEYRLPREVLDFEIAQMVGDGVEVKTGARVTDPAALLKTATGDFDAVFVAIGASASRRLNVPGEDSQGVWGALEFLREVNAGAQPGIGANVLVIGGGDVAMDVARCALRLPGVKNVNLACLERREEMPAHSWEAVEALEEGVKFHNSLGPARILAEGGRATGVEFRACTQVFDQTGRFAPEFDDSRTSTLAAGTVIVAIGQGVDGALLAGVDAGPGGRIVADGVSLATGVPGVFAGGDAVLGPASAIDAIAHGHRVAEAIGRYLRGESQPEPSESKATAPNPRPDAPRAARKEMPQSPVTERLRDARQIDLGYSEEDAVAEAQRCLACGLCSECRLCETVCAPGAICHDMQPETETLKVGSIILTPGFDEIQASLRGEYGHGHYANVLSSVQFERMLSASGPTEGHVLRRSDGEPVKRIAFIQCVGSRDSVRGNGYCSSICCMSATKEALVAIEHVPGLEVSVFCMDVRAFGKEFDRYVTRAKDENVRYVRAIPSRVMEMPGTRTPRVRYFDESGDEKNDDYDLVILSVGMKPGRGIEELAERLGIERNQFGFCETDRLAPVVTSTPGIFVAGAFQEPKDIPESVAQASGAASCAMEMLARGRNTLTQRHEYPRERDVTDEEPRVGVFICHCGHNIASVVDVEAVARDAKTLPNVALAETNLYTCSDTSLERIQGLIKKHRLNRVVVASCSPRTHEPLFQETLRESGLNAYLFSMTNIRDQVSWVHRDDPVAATEKAIDLMRMAVGRARHLRALETGRIAVKRSALVLGGGLAGMTAALSIAEQGFDVDLVEKDASLGGNLRHIHTTLEGDDIQAFQEKLVAQTESHPLISVHLGSQLAEFGGHVGNFHSRIDGANGSAAIEHGVTIIATGAVERSTDEHLRGANPRVVTQRELETKLAEGKLDIADDGTVVMIQCVGSRNDENPYCSRVCCSEAVKNALSIKSQRPEAQVFVLAKDIRTYGFRETYFQKAREAGVIFVRFPEDTPPQTTGNDGLTVRVVDGATRRTLVLEPDLLVLSTGIAPGPDNKTISGAMRTPLTADGFFLEAHPKLRPVDVASEGIFVCGLAHSPRFMDETIAQARAAAGRAATVLSKPYLEVGGQIAHVDTMACIACMTCVKVCPYGAPALNERNRVEIQAAKCQGCGSCASACPAQAISLQHQEERQLVAMLDELLVGVTR